MNEAKKIRESLNRHVFSENPFDEAMKESMAGKVKGKKGKMRNRPIPRLKPVLSACLLVAAAACFIFFVAQGTLNERGGSSASWAYPFVQLDGKTYVMTDQAVPEIQKPIGTITSYSDREGAETSGNFSNALPEGTEMFSIPGVDPEKAIAVETDRGTYIKAIASDIWRKKHLDDDASEEFEFAAPFIDSLNRYREIKVGNIKESPLKSVLPDAKTARIETNIGVINIAVFPGKANVTVRNTSDKDIPGNYNYVINGNSFSTTEKLYFTQDGRYFMMTYSKDLDDYVKAEKAYAQIPEIKETPWEVSPVFDINDEKGSVVYRDRVQGVEHKIGFLQHPEQSNFVAKDKRSVTKMFWYVWGNPDQLKGKRLTAFAVQKGTGEKFLVDRVELQDPVYGEDAGALTSFAPFPEKGLWRIDVFIGGEYLDSIVVRVKAPYIQTENYKFLLSQSDAIVGEHEKVSLILTGDHKKESLEVTAAYMGDFSHKATFQFKRIDKYIREGNPITLYQGSLSFSRAGKWKITVLGEETIVYVKNK